MLRCVWHAAQRSSFCEGREFVARPAVVKLDVAHSPFELNQLSQILFENLYS